MKRTVVMLRLTLAVGLAVGMLGDHVLHAQQTADMEKVKAANQAFYEALSARDIKRMEQIWSHEPHVRAIPPASTEVLSGWEAVRKHWEEAFARRPEQVSVSMKDAQVRVDQNVAWIVGAEQVQGRQREGKQSLPWYWARMFSRNRVATGSWCITMVLAPPPHSVLCKTRVGVAGRFLRLHVPWGGLR
jgi:ketosteroid isomerase-like protein